jgi:hypothetical protein
MQKTNFIKIRPVGIELLHTESWNNLQTERHDEDNSEFLAILRIRLKTNKSIPHMTIIAVNCRNVPSHFKRRPQVAARS